MKNVHVLICLLAVSLFFVSCDKNNDKKVTPLTLDKDKVTVVVGATDVVTIKTGEAPFKINVRQPETASVTLDKTKASIKGLKEGETVVTIADKNGKVAAVNVKVTKAK